MTAAGRWYPSRGDRLPALGVPPSGSGTATSMVGGSATAHATSSTVGHAGASTVAATARPSGLPTHGSTLTWWVGSALRGCQRGTTDWRPNHEPTKRRMPTKEMGWAVAGRVEPLRMRGQVDADVFGRWVTVGGHPASEARCSQDAWPGHGPESEGTRWIESFGVADGYAWSITRKIPGGTTRTCISARGAGS